MIARGSDAPGRGPAPSTRNARESSVVHIHSSASCVTSGEFRRCVEPGDPGRRPDDPSPRTHPCCSAAVVVIALSIAMLSASIPAPVVRPADLDRSLDRQRVRQADHRLDRRGHRPADQPVGERRLEQAVGADRAQGRPVLDQDARRLRHQRVLDAGRIHLHQRGDARLRPVRRRARRRHRSRDRPHRAPPRRHRAEQGVDPQRAVRDRLAVLAAPVPLRPAARKPARWRASRATTRTRPTSTA